ncbi:MAG: DUF1641 domain-containing protein [Myxococcota bacterium]
MTTLEDLSARMDRLEGTLGRLTTLLEDRLAPTLPERAASRATAELSAVHGSDPLADRMSELMVQLGDPETLGSLTRLIALAPKLEYAAYLAAAGPELLEDALATTQDRIRALGLDPADVDHRVRRASETLTEWTEGRTLQVLKRFSALLPSCLPMAEAAAEAVRLRTEHEGQAELQERMVEGLLQLSDPETQEALIRIAGLAPKLEYAAYFAAAGPELLEEAMELARTKAAEHQVDPRVLAHRLSQATDLLIVYTGADQVDLLRQIGHRSPHLAPVLRASTAVLEQRAAIEGKEGLEERLYEALLELSDPETLASVTRLAALAPKLEYAAYFASAGPELLEELTDGVRAWAADRGVAGVDARIEAGLDALVTLSTPATLKGLAGVSAILASIPDSDEGAGSLQRMMTRLPRMEHTLGQVERTLDMLDRASTRAGIGTIEDLEGPATAGLDLLKIATEPGTMKALETVIGLAPDLVRLVGPFMRQLGEIDEGTLGKALQFLTSRETLELAALLHDRTPALRALLEAADLDPSTLALLKATNEAAAAAVATPTEPVGLFGLLRALGDPQVQRTLGFGVNLSRALSSRVTDLRRLEGAP